MLYNGAAPYPERQTIRLSDSFEDVLPYGISAENLPPLELIAKVYNINEGYNPEIVRRSETLDGYSVFIAKAREYEMEIAAGTKRALTKGELKDAMTKAIRWCIDHNKLKQFLETNSSEVINMLITEWDWDKYVAVQRREAVEEGRMEGRMEGRIEGRMEIARSALAEGASVEFVRKITGIDAETIQRLTNR
ncbi:MAG: hypothetical protein Pg6A_10070 [Termitinemataceae bacterium]|nr:MAG: hypothetical protein Pg6A_10070 [Termitinemataceae bacterium]